jgi:hypothetical protein
VERCGGWSWPPWRSWGSRREFVTCKRNYSMYRDSGDAIECLGTAQADLSLCTVVRMWTDKSWCAPCTANDCRLTFTSWFNYKYTSPGWTGGTAKLDQQHHGMALVLALPYSFHPSPGSFEPSCLTPKRGVYIHAGNDPSHYLISEP